jgi:hypothetical protein
MPQVAGSESKFNLQIGKYRNSESGILREVNDSYRANEELGQSTVGIPTREASSRLSRPTPKRSEPDMHGSPSATAPTTFLLAFGKQPMAQTIGSMDEIQHISSITPETLLYDDSQKLGTGRKSNSQNLNLPIVENIQSFITKEKSTIADLPHITPGVILESLTPKNEMEKKTMLDSQKERKRFQSLFLIVLEKLRILKKEEPVKFGYIRLRWQCVSFHSPPKLSTSAN